MSVRDRWHLARPEPGTRKCGKHRKVPSSEHEQGLQWQVEGIDDHGQTIRRNFEIKADAEAFDAELKSAVRAGTYVDDRAGKVTFRQFAEEWRLTRMHDHSTAERLERALRLHCYAVPGERTTPRGGPAIGDVPMSVLGRRVSVTQAWVAGLHLHPNSARLLIDRVSAIFEYAVDDRIIARNPLKAKSIDLPDRVGSKAIAWSSERIETVIGEMSERLQAVGLLGAVTGMRQGEMFGLAVDDVDWLHLTAHVEVQVKNVGGGLAFGPLKNWKTTKSRDVPIAANVVPLLSHHVERYPSVPVTLPWSQKGSKMDGKPVTRRLLFTDHLGRAYYRQTVNRDWMRAWKAAGVPDLGRHNGMHVLRHTAASRWLSRGLNIAKVAHYLGDTVAVVLNTYAHFLPEDDDLGRRIMDGFLSLDGPSPASELPHTFLSEG